MSFGFLFLLNVTIIFRRYNICIHNIYVGTNCCRHNLKSNISYFESFTFTDFTLIISTLTQKVYRQVRMKIVYI